MDRVIGVVGAGAMGAGIAQVAAAADKRATSIEQVSCNLTGPGRIADLLARALSLAHVPFERHSGSTVCLHLASPGTTPVILTPTDGRPAAQLARECGGSRGVFDWPLGDSLPDSLAITFAAGCPEPSRGLGLSVFRRLGIRTAVVTDTPGLIVARNQRGRRSGQGDSGCGRDHPISLD